MKEKTAIIIGAGPAGLTAAMELLDKTDIMPIILEESGEIGGISKTVNYNGNRIDIGGHRFFSKNEDVMKIWTDLMPVQGKPALDDKILNREKDISHQGPNPEKENIVMLIRNRVSRILYLNKFFDYPISPKLQTFKNLGLIRTIKIGFSYVKAVAFKRDEKSLEDFFINRFGKELYLTFFKDYTEKVWGTDCKDIPSDWGKQRIKGVSVSKIIKDIFLKLFNKKDSKKVETSLIEEFYYPKYGPGQLWETMAKKVEEKGGKILLNSKVIGINTKNNKIVSVVVENNNGREEKQCDYCISSMPIKDLIQAIDKNVPEDIKDISVNLPYRDFITVGLLVKNIKLENRTKIKTVSNIIPDTWIYIQEQNVKIGRLQIFNNWSPYMVKDLQNTVWIGLEYFCNEFDDMWNMEEEAFINFAIDELVKINVINKEDVIDSIRIKVKKAYPAYFGTYYKFNQVRDYLNTFDNLYCVGRNGQHRYNNMDHSMLTSIKAVEIIKNNIKTKDDLWQINAEEEYHETKKEI